MRWASHVLDGYIAPHLSELTQANVPEVADFPNHLGSMALNSIFVAKIYDEYKVALLSSFINHLATATRDYRLAREHLVAYFRALPDHDKLSDHRIALSHFEGSVMHLAIAMISLSRLGQLLGHSKVFDKRDNSDYARLHEIHNRIKHFDEDVDAAFKNGIPVPLSALWLTNQGLQTSTASLGYDELALILVTQETDAKGFSTDIFEEAIAFRKKKQSVTG